MPSVYGGEGKRGELDEVVFGLRRTLNGGFRISRFFDDGTNLIFPSVSGDGEAQVI